jgi:hypothetical protein
VLISSHFRLPATLLVTALIGACQATPQLTLSSTPAYSPEWCAAAKSLAPNSGSNLFATGRCHELGIAGFPKEENLYLFYYTQGARWGSLQAAEALARLGQPVPDADLQAEARDRADQRRADAAMAAAIRGVNPPGPPRPSPMPMTPTVRFPSTTFQPARIQPTPMRPAPSMTIPTQSSQPQGRTTTQSRRECTNGVCKTVTTTCVNGACTTSSQ